MKAEYGKYYELDNRKSYFVPDLQRRVKFPDKLCVKCDSGYVYDESFHFGKLINLGLGIYSDIVTNIDIEFLDNDVLNEYQLQTNNIDCPGKRYINYE